MPLKSQSQRGIMYATEAGAHTGIPKSVAEEFIASDKPGKLPQHVGHAFGGGIGADRPHLQVGGQGEFGGLGAANPWWERTEARRLYDQPFGGGFIGSSGAGRTDQIPLSVAADSHIMPADVVAGLGQGNGLHGARVLNEALRIGPYGTPLPAHVRGPGPPHPPGISGREVGLAMADGGDAHDEKPPHKTSILVAGGEYHVPSHDWVAEDEHGQLQLHAGVQTVGGGDYAKGHKRLDEVIHRVRAHTINFLKHAPPPKK